MHLKTAVAILAAAAASVLCAPGTAPASTQSVEVGQKCDSSTAANFAFGCRTRTNSLMVCVADQWRFLTDCPPGTTCANAACVNATGQSVVPYTRPGIA
ncbi:hypothetical protein H4R18_001614, partial [Coemansia javaensis]